MASAHPQPHDGADAAVAAAGAKAALTQSVEDSVTAVADPAAPAPASQTSVDAPQPVAATGTVAISAPTVLLTEVVRPHDVSATPAPGPDEQPVVYDTVAAPSTPAPEAIGTAAVSTEKGTLLKSSRLGWILMFMLCSRRSAFFFSTEVERCHGVHRDNWTCSSTRTANTPAGCSGPRAGPPCRSEVRGI